MQGMAGQHTLPGQGGPGHQLNMMNNMNIQQARQAQQQQGFHGQQTGYGGQQGMMGTGHGQQGMMGIPQIEITRGTPSESLLPMDGYTEEEYDAMRRAGRFGASPAARRQLTEYEKQHFPGQQGKGAAARGVRWFVALYDYDPVSMSPNPDAADEELGFREGDLIKVGMRSAHLRLRHC